MKHATESVAHHEHLYDEETPSWNAARVVHVLRAQLPMIALAVGITAVIYAIAAAMLYVSAPSQRTTVQPFRLNFKGASEGQYPNGLRFSAADIVTTPVLLRVHRDSGLARFVTFSAFTRSVFVLEHNTALEALAAEYRARLADPKLSPVDRDRLVAEYENKRASLAKNDYALHFVRSDDTASVPDGMVRKVLSDILQTWAHRAVNEQRVLELRFPVASPEVLNPTPIEQTDVVAAVHVLRSKINRIIGDIQTLQRTPGADIVRTRTDRLSLPELRVRLEDINRLRLEPIIPLLRTTGVPDPVATRRFMETQLASDRRQLRERQIHIEAIRETLATYSLSRNGLTAEAGEVRERTTTDEPNEQQTVAQVSDTFIDRLVTLANQSADIEYRQRLTTDLRTAAELMGPAQQAVNYDEEVLAMLAGVPATPGADAPARAQVEAARAEARALVVKLNELHRLLSENLNPPTELVTLNGVPTTMASRAFDAKKVLAGGVVTILVALLVAAIAALMRDHIREEDEIAAHAAEAHVA